MHTYDTARYIIQQPAQSDQKEKTIRDLKLYISIALKKHIAIKVSQNGILLQLELRIT